MDDTGQVCGANQKALSETAEGSGVGPAGMVALCFVIGVACGAMGGLARVWLVATAIIFVAGFALMVLRRWRVVVPMLLLGILTAGGAWFAVRERTIAGDDLRHYIRPASQIAELTGVIDTPPALTSSAKGAFGKFSYRPPGTVFVLDVEAPAKGLVLVKMEEAEHRLRIGDRVRVTGWLSAIEGPANPGEFNWATAAAQQGVYGRLTLPNRGNCVVLGSATRGWVPRFRQLLSNTASQSLRIGMRPDGEAMELLDALLLGRRSSLPDELNEAFRRTGLYHVLSISGGHVAILLWIIWLAARGVAGHPRRAAALVMAVLLLYLLALPSEVPIVRAGIMAGLFIAAQWWGRRVRGIDLLLAAAVIALLWRPGDIMNAGAQLSFGAVAALLLFTRGVGEAIWPRPTGPVITETAGMWLSRRGADYLAVNVVAFVAVSPLVLMHFKAFTPLSIPVSMLALPLVAVVLTAGYVKILAGMLWPSLGLMLAGPVTWYSDGLLRLVSHASTWPGSMLHAARSPSAAWTAGALAVAAALLAGGFARRKLALAMSLLIVGGWMALELRREPAPAPSACTVHMISVGDGSCFLVRLPGYTMLFDCGSQEYLDVGIKSVVPAMHHLGVDHLDAVFLSHADFDHYCGLLDVLEQVPASRVYLSPQMKLAAERSPQSSTAYLLETLAKRGLPAEPITAGWTQRHGEATLTLLWPPPLAELHDVRSNDTSLVLRINATERGPRLLLSGDIGDLPMRAMIERGAAAKAEICDLPHHGSFAESSPAWMDYVKPRMVLQSSGWRRLDRDHWPPVLGPRGIERFVTARDGMVTVQMGEGGIQARTFRNAHGH